MDLIVKSRNIEIPEAVRQYALKKINTLNRHLPSLRDAEMLISQEKTKKAGTRFVVQVTINSNGMILRGEESAADTFTAIDAVMDMIDRRIERFKGRLDEKGKGSAALKAITESMPVVPEEQEEGRVVRVKRFPMKPMFEEEAAAQMELLGHDFYFFFNAATAQFNVVYRRKDGGYGLIEPEMD